MSPKPLQYLAFFVVLLMSSQVVAGELTWMDCVKRAAEGNPDIRAARQNLDSYENKAKAAYSGFLPHVSGTLSIERGNVSSTWGSSDTDNKYSASVTAGQNLFKGFYDKGLVRQGAANRDAYSAALANAKVQVSYDLKSAYAALMYSQDYLKLAGDIIKRRDENASLVELRFEGGLENRGSVLLSKAFLGQARYDKLTARHSIEVSREKIAKVLGIDGSGDIRISGGIPIAEPGGEPEIVQIALKNPLYLKAVAEERSAKASVTLAGSKFSPTLDLVAKASRQGNSWFPKGDNNSVGLSLGVPFFNGGNDYYSLMSSKAGLAAAKAGRESVERQLLPQLRQTYDAYVDAYEKLKVDRDFLEAATVRAEIARGKYNNGLLSFEDWDIIENDLIAKQKTVILSERDLNLAEAAWLQAQGKGVIP